MREEHEMEAETERQLLQAEADDIEEKKAAEALRVLHMVEDPSKWGGCELGQQWFPRDANRPVYITDLVHMPGGKFVTYADAVGKKIGSLTLSLFLTKYERR